jgi:hypothetical protein
VTAPGRAGAAGWMGLALALCACGPPSGSGDGAGAPAPLAFDPARLSATARLEGGDVSLKAELWLDHSPAPGRAGGPLYLSVHVAPEGGGPLPGGLTADRVWVIGGDHTWETAFDRLRLEGDALEGLVAGGPELDPKLPADVVVRLRGPGDAVRFVRVRLPGVPTAH